MIELKKTIGENIRFERVSRNMSLEDLAEILGITSGFLGLVERGHRGTDITNIIKISDAFGITIDDLTKKRPTGFLKVAETAYSTLDNKRAALIALVHNLSGEELEFVISTIRELKILLHKE